MAVEVDDDEEGGWEDEEEEDEVACFGGGRCTRGDWAGVEGWPAGRAWGGAFLERKGEWSSTSEGLMLRIGSWEEVWDVSASASSVGSRT
jgi:hypothetical protein